MRIEFARTTGWYSESGQATWGLGVEVHNFANFIIHTEHSEAVPEGWQVSILLGPWAINLFSEAGFQSVYGLSTEHYGRFLVTRP